jgi:hypothetical protein
MSGAFLLLAPFREQDRREQDRRAILDPRGDPGSAIK